MIKLDVRITTLVNGDVTRSVRWEEKVHEHSWNKPFGFAGVRIEDGQLILNIKDTSQMMINVGDEQIPFMMLNGQEVRGPFETIIGNGDVFVVHHPGEDPGLVHRETMMLLEENQDSNP